jgi:membrane associated rhomboid family serine protease
VARTFLPEGLDDSVVDALAFDPDRLYRDGLEALPSLVTYQFLHGSWAHLGMNMLSLLAFGPGIERPLRGLRFLVLYLVSGIIGALLEGLFLPVAGSEGILIGASASIAGIFGALLILWRFSRSGRMRLLPLAAIWIIVMAITGIAGVGSDGEPVAWIAHIGGFLTGFLLVKPLARGWPGP